MNHDEQVTAFWRRYDEIEARLSAPLSERMVDLAQLRPGMRVLDIASGRGEPAIQAAQIVGPDGFVLGIDRNGGVLEIARERARALTLGNVTFRVADAETFESEPEASFDVATCRWALMYFESPRRALEQIQRALKPGGALVAALWAEPDRVSWSNLRRRVLSRFQTVGPIAPDVPGVFRYSDPDVIRRDWSACGFRIERVEELDVPIIESPDAAGIVAWYRALSTSSPGELPEETQRAYEEELAREAEQYRVGDRILLGGVTRIVVARR